MATYSADISVKVVGLTQLKNLENRLTQLQERFTKINAASAQITAPFKAHIEALRTMNTLLTQNGRLLNAQASAVDKATGSRGGGRGPAKTDSRLEKERSDELQRQLGLLKDRARVLQGNTTIMAKLLRAEVEITAAAGGNVKLGKELMKNARSLLAAEEKLVKAKTAAADQAITDAERERKARLKTVQDEWRATEQVLKKERAARNDRGSTGRGRGSALRTGLNVAGRAGTAIDRSFGGAFSGAGRAVEGAAIRGGAMAGGLAAAGGLDMINNIAGKVPGISAASGAIADLVSALANLPGGIGAAAVAAAAFAPWLPKIAEGAYAAGDALGKLEAAKPLKNFLGKGGASFFESATNALGGMSAEVKSITGGPALDLSRKGGAFSSKLGLELIDKAAKEMYVGIQKAADAQEKAVATAKSWSDALRQGNQWMSETAKKVAEADKKLADQVSRASSSTGIRKTEASAAVQERKELERTVQLMRERNALLQGNQDQYSRPAGPGGDTRKAQPQYLQYLNEQVLATRNFGKERRVAMQLADRQLSTEQKIAEVLKRQATEQAKTNKRREEQQKKREGLGESLALGVGFPLLFGAGPGSIAGSAVGSFAGSGFGGQILGGAIGAMFDQFGAAAIAMGQTLRDPITNFQKIADAGLLAGKSQEFYVSKLIAVGRITEAIAVVQGELIKKIGAGGVSDLNEAGAAADRLGKVWAELTLQLQAAIAGPLADLLDWVTNLVEVGNAFRRDQSKFNDVRNGLNSKDRAQFDKRNEAITGLSQRGLAFGGITLAERETRRRALVQEYEGRSKPPTVRGTTVSPEAREQARKAAEAQADAIQSAYREAFQLQRQAADISIAAADYRRKIESDIFAKNQEAARVEIDNARKAAQVQIEASDLALRKQFSGSQGLTEELLTGVRAFIEARRSGEADIEQKRRQLELTLADISKATSDYVYEQARTRLQMERQIEDYKMATADYQLKVARQIQDENRIAAAGSGNGGPVASVATGAFAALSRVIGSQESYGGNYGAFNRGGSNGGHTAHGSGIDPNLVNMTIAEIQRRQLAPGVPKNQQLHAVGKYQIIGGTLRGLLNGSYGPTGVKSTDKFTPEVQEQLGAALARNRIVPGNVGASMRGLRSEWIGLQNAPDSALRPAVEAMMSGGGVGAQLSRAAGMPQRPAFAAPEANTQGMADAQNRLAAARKQEVVLAEKLNQLNIDKAQFDLQEIARGKLQTEALTQQRNLEQSKLQVMTTAGALSENEVERLLKQKEGEAQINAIFTARDAAILKINDGVKTGKITQDEAKVVLKEINTGIEQRLNNTRTQIALDQELLKIQQAQKLAMDAQAMQRELMSTGQGIKAGFTGGASSKYDQIYGQTGDAALANQFAQAQGVLDQLQNAQADASALGGSIAGGFKAALVAAASGGDILGAFTAMFEGLGSKFLDMAFKPVEETLTQAVFGMLAPSQQQVSASMQNLSAAQVMLTASVNFQNAAAAMAAGGGGGGGGLLKGLLSSAIGAIGGSFTGGLSSAIPTDAGGWGQAFATNLSFAGGGYTGNGARFGGVDGQGGFPAILHPQETVIDHTQNALAQSRGALGGGGVTSDAAFSENRDALNTISSTSRERQVERWITSGAGSTEIKYSRVGAGDLPFVTEQDMLQATRVAAQEGARMGQQRTMAALKNNPGARRTIGI